MVVLIKKKRNSVKDKRYIKIQGKYTKRFLHSKKNPGKQIYMQRGGMSDDNAQRLATIAAMIIMFAPFCVDSVRNELLNLIKSFGMSETAAVEFYAVVDYCTNLKDISVDILPYVPVALQHTASGFARFTLATATFIAKHYWNYKSLITRFQAIKAGISSIFGMTCQPLMKFAQDQVSSVKASVEFAKYMQTLVYQGGKFTLDTSISILQKIYENVLKPIIVYYLSAADQTAVETIKAADMYGAQIWGNVKYFKDLILEAEKSKPVEKCKQIYTNLIEAYGMGGKIVEFTVVNGVKMGRFVKEFPKKLLYSISEKAYYSLDEARFYEIALDDEAIQKVENEAKKEKLIRDKAEKVAEASAVNYLLKTGIINERGELNIDADALDLSKVVAVSQGTGEIAQDMLIHSFDIDDGPTPTIVSETVLDVAASAAAAGKEVEEVIAKATEKAEKAVQEVRAEKTEFDSNLRSSKNKNDLVNAFNIFPRRSYTDSKKFIEGLKDEIKNLQMSEVESYFLTPSGYEPEFVESQPEFRISPSPEPEEPKPTTYSAAVRSSSLPPSASKSKLKKASASKKPSASNKRLFKILGNKKPSLSTVAEEGPTTGGGTRKRIRYGKRKTQRRQRQRRRHH